MDQDSVGNVAGRVRHDPARWATGMFKRPSTLVLLGVIALVILVFGTAFIVSLLPDNS